MPQITNELLEEYLQLTPKASHELAVSSVQAAANLAGKIIDDVEDPSINMEQTHLIFLGTMIGVLIFFFVIGSCTEHYKPKVGHETSATLILGIIISMTLYAFVGQSYREYFRFDPNVFFFFFLPPIIFNSGYNMRQKKFFQNLGNISLLGLLTTLVIYIIFGVLAWAFLTNIDFEMINYVKKAANLEESEYLMKIDISIMQILLFMALLVSSDVVAAVSIVSYQEQPKLYSCIFGEGVFNDIVSIILFNTVQQLQEITFEWWTPFMILGEFIMLGIISLSVGLVIGLIVALLFKHVRFLTTNAITETFLMFAMCLSSYFISELIDIAGITMSGIISLLAAGIIQSHYTWYNLSPQGKTTSTVTIGFLGVFAEASVYSYVGLALYSSIPGWWSLYLILTLFGIIVVGRFSGVFMVFYATRLCCKKKTINARELTFISYAGMIRGAIAFALVLQIPVCTEEQTENNDQSCFDRPLYELLISTTLALVMLTTILFGSFMGLVQNLLCPPSIKDKVEVEQMQRTKSHFIEQTIEAIKVEIGDEEHEYEEILHPNNETEEEEEEKKRTKSYFDINGADPSSWADSTFVRWFGRFDENALKPFFIRNYCKATALMSEEYQEILKNRFDDADELEVVERVEQLTRTVSVIASHQRTKSTLLEEGKLVAVGPGRFASVCVDSSNPDHQRATFPLAIEEEDEEDDDKVSV